MRLLAICFIFVYSLRGEVKTTVDVELLQEELKTVKAANAQLASQVQYLIKQLELQKATYDASTSFLAKAKEKGEKACPNKGWKVENGIVVCVEENSGATSKK